MTRATMRSVLFIHLVSRSQSVQCVHLSAVIPFVAGPHHCGLLSVIDRRSVCPPLANDLNHAQASWVVMSGSLRIDDQYSPSLP